MPRTRSLIIDNTVGRMFTNTTSVAVATAANQIAGLSTKSNQFGLLATVSARVVNNIGLGSGFSFSGDTIIKQISVSAYIAGGGAADTVVKVRTGSTYNTSTIQSTITLVSTSKLVTVNTAIAANTTVNLFFDVTSVPSSPPRGLTIKWFYY